MFSKEGYTINFEEQCERLKKRIADMEDRHTKLSRYLDRKLSELRKLYRENEELKAYLEKEHL